MILDYVDEKSVGYNDGQEEAYQALAAKVPVEKPAKPGDDWSYLYRRNLAELEKAMLPAERQELSRLERIHKARQIPTVKIELNGLLRMRRSDGMPLWTVANPFHSIGQRNGAVQADWSGVLSNKLDGYRYYVEQKWGDSVSDVVFASRRDDMIVLDTRLPLPGLASDHGSSRNKVLVPTSGFPPIPTRVRELIDKFKYLVQCVAILYQPTSWAVQAIVPPNPDPALLVKLSDNEPFRCAAVWGHDGALIKEFTAS